MCSEESEESKDEQFLSLAEHSGYDLHTIKETVASIRDRSLQRRLKDSDRNNSFRKVALDSRHGKKHLLLESDDIVLILDCALVGKDLGNHAIIHWFFKQDERYLLDKEKTYQEHSHQATCAKQTLLRRNRGCTGVTFDFHQSSNYLHGLTLRDICSV